MPPSTGTLCPFPRTTADGGATPPASLADCTLSFADASQPLYDIIDALLGIVGVATLAITAARMVALKRLADAQHKYLTEMTTFEFFVFALIFTLAVALQSIDLWSMRGWVAVEFYFMVDEFTALSAVAMGICMVDFWRKLEHGIGRHGLEPRFKRAYMIVSCINFPLWEACGLANPELYSMFEGIKDLFGSVLASTLVALSFVSIRGLLRTLNRSATSSDDATAAPGARAGAGLNNRSSMSRRAARTLVTKYALFCLAATIATAAFFAASIIALTADSYAWKMTPADASDATAVAFKIVYLLICFCIVYFFKVPRASGARSGQKAAVNDSSHDNTGASSSYLTSKRAAPAATPHESIVVGVHGGSSSVADPVEVIDQPNPRAGPKFWSSERSLLRKDILANDGVMRQRFVEFVKSKYASESLNCYDAIVHFKQIDDAHARDKAGSDIVSRFIVPGGAETVTTPDAVRRALETLHTFPPEAFDVVQIMCFNVLKDNFLAEFIEREAI